MLKIIFVHDAVFRYLKVLGMLLINLLGHINLFLCLNQVEGEFLNVHEDT